MLYKYQQTSVVLSATWSSLSPIIDPKAFTIATPLSADNSETEIDLFMLQVFPKKFTQRKQRWTTKIPFHPLHQRNNGCLALLKTKTKTRTHCLLVKIYLTRHHSVEKGFSKYTGTIYSPRKIVMKMLNSFMSFREKIESIKPQKTESWRYIK